MDASLIKKYKSAFVCVCSLIEENLARSGYSSAIPPKDDVLNWGKSCLRKQGDFATTSMSLKLVGLSRGHTPSITVYLGVEYPSIASRLSPVPSIVEFSRVHAQLGWVAGITDIYFSRLDINNIEKSYQEILYAFNDHGVKFFDRYSCVDKLIYFLRNPSADNYSISRSFHELHLAAALYSVGHEYEAIRILEDYVERQQSRSQTAIRFGTEMLNLIQSGHAR